MVIIIGAGPAGLSVAQQLQQHAVPYVVLERESVGNSWRNHYESLDLHTPKQMSHLPDLSYPAQTARFPSRDDFLQHQIDYARHFGLNILTGVDVRQLTWQEDSAIWKVDSGERAFSAKIAVAASGIWSTPFCPRFDGQDNFSGEILHVNDYRSSTPFLGRRVLVVGAGNSAADVAVELGDAGVDCGIVVRDGVDFIPYPKHPLQMSIGAWAGRNLPEAIGNRLLARTRRTFPDLQLPGNRQPPLRAYPVVGFKLPQAVEQGSVRVHHDIERLEANGVQFADGSRRSYDVLILATGYRPTLHYLQQPDGSDGEQSHFETDQAGWPIVKPSGQSTIQPQLYLVGFQYPAWAGWIQNMNRQARLAAKQIVDQYSAS